MTRKTAKNAKADARHWEPGATGLSRAEWIASAIATAAMNPAATKAGGGRQRKKRFERGG